MVYIKCDTCTTKYYIRADSPLLKSTSSRKPRCSKCAHRKFSSSGHPTPRSKDKISQVCYICKSSHKVRVDSIRKLKGRYKCKKCSNRVFDSVGNIVPRAYDRIKIDCVICRKSMLVDYRRCKTPETYKCHSCASSNEPSNKLTIDPDSTYGRLTIISEVAYSHSGHSRVFKCSCKCGKTKDVMLNSLRAGHTQSCGCRNDSGPEEEVYEFISGLVDKTLIVRNCRKTIGGLELDILINRYKLAFEFNGVYFHSERFKDKDYHLDKTKRCMGRGISLLHIWEDDWKSKRDIIKTRIEHLLKIKKVTMFARKTKIISIRNSDKNKFFDLNHIQGACSTTIDLGLGYQEELIACMSFVKTPDNVFYLVRYAASIPIVGGFSKLLSEFKRLYRWERLIAFSDTSWSTGDLYEKTGWTRDKVLKPDYKYVIRGVRKHKSEFRRKGFKKKLNTYDSNISEHQNMLNNGIYRIYDCGKIRYTQENKDISG